MKTIPLILCLLLSSSLLFGQNPKLPSDSENQEPPASCEPFVAASYDQGAATLTLRLETCGMNELFYGFLWCGIIDYAARKEQQSPQLVVGSLHGSIHFQDTFEGRSIPEEMRVSSLYLNPGIYYVRLRGVTDQGDLYSKFLVK